MANRAAWTLSAGAERLVMSMWHVDDFATKTLMAGLYKKKPKYAHPFYWAAFLPAGATTPLKD
jgi:CHAT domain-containing protein